jgi:hypothetical protein
MRTLIALTAVAFAAALPGSAAAGIVTGSISDPDGPLRAVAGVEAPPLVARVDVSYDSDSGRAATDVTFAAPVPVPSTYGFVIGIGARTHGRCDTNAGLHLSLSALSDDLSGFFTRHTSIGIYPVPVTWNATRTSVHLEMTQAEAAGGHYDCCSRPGRQLSPRRRGVSAALAPAARAGGAVAAGSHAGADAADDPRARLRGQHQRSRAVPAHAALLSRSENWLQESRGVRRSRIAPPDHHATFATSSYGSE